jgi:hypothetical protein
MSNIGTCHRTGLNPSSTKAASGQGEIIGTCLLTGKCPRLRIGVRARGTDMAS